MRTIGSKLLELAEKAGVVIDTTRSAFGSYVWDGKTIASHTHHWNEWDIKYDIQHFSNEFLLHEVAHFMVANTYQRSLPEYGLDQHYLKRGEIVPGILFRKEKLYLEKKARIQTEKLEKLI